ncbi:MAG: GntR family transcriptional regulator [Tissierellia bacterium]|nr:GntR family transcriptional regulator [Tissierellia bacterium]
MKQLPHIKTTGTLSERTYEILKSEIVNLELKPGQLITVEDISEQLGVSRTPIRTALNRLIEEDLVEILPGKGTFVTRLIEKDAIDLLNVRGRLECYSIELASILRTTEDLENLEYLINKQELITKGSHRKQQDFLNNDSEFHNTIAKISKNKYLEKQLMQMHTNCMRYLNESTIDYVIYEASEEHIELFEQIKNQNTEKAILYMQKHIENIKNRVIGHLKYN